MDPAWGIGLLIAAVNLIGGGLVIRWLVHQINAMRGTIETQDKTLKGPHAGERIRDPRKAWASACKAAGRPGTRIHDLRRSAVRTMEQAGVPRSVAMKLTGHRTEAVYRRYAIVSPADLQEASRRLSGITTGIAASTD
jgi:integrase